MEAAISNRIAASETFVTTAQTQLDAFMQRNNDLMQMISENDLNVKTAFETRVNAMELEYRTALTDASAMSALIFTRNFTCFGLVRLGWRAARSHYNILCIGGRPSCRFWELSSIWVSAEICGAHWRSAIGYHRLPLPGFSFDENAAFQFWGCRPCRLSQSQVSYLRRGLEDFLCNSELKLHHLKTTREKGPAFVECLCGQSPTNVCAHVSCLVEKRKFS
mgnify:CR=1 FL=1